MLAALLAPFIVAVFAPLVRRFAGPWQWFTFVFFALFALPFAWLRELPKGNAGAAVSKGKGLLEGLRVPLGQPPPASI